MHNISHWLASLDWYSIINWIAFITGVICVYLIVVEKDVNWPIGILNSIALLYVFFLQKLHAQVLLQAFYIVEGAYGWWMWTRRDKITREKLVKIGRTKEEFILIISMIGIAGTFAFYELFKRTGDPSPFWDSLVTVLSLIAEYMLCLKLLESWAVYLVSDIILISLLISMGEKLTAATYVCFVVLCAWGLIRWSNTLIAKRRAIAC